MYIYVAIPKFWDTMWGDPVAFRSKKRAEEFAATHYGEKTASGAAAYEIYKVYLRA
jgi:hypothetical protein